MDLTQEIILQHGRNSPYKGEIINCTKSVEIQNLLCGDSLKLDIKIDGETITGIAFSGEGCLISQASISLLIEKAKKIKDIDKINKFNEKTVFKLLGVKLTLSRQKCALLGLEALKKATLQTQL